MTPQRWLELWSERMHNYAHLAMSALSTLLGYEVIEIRQMAGFDFPHYHRRWQLAFWHYREALTRVRQATLSVETVVR